MIGKRPTLSPKPTPLSFHKSTPLTQSSMHSGGHKPKPTGNRPPPPPPQGKSGWQDKMQKFMNKQNRVGLETTINSITDIYEENEKLKQQLRDYRKDAEIQKLQEEIYDMRLHAVTIMSPLEKDRADVFSSHHAVSCKSGIQYIVFGTGIGTNTKVKCRKCQEEQDITDYEGW